ncbi:acetylxylan esterase [Anaeromyces robustus]|jgi:hypothetical protein|uniref:Acetylxylan esterase n=1 Tax=Anaeromyces robustus TaxID=1754192 RepID=A0A1Y1X8Y1_9FUNG|nr:acetylxylan esterase [Anaeromyces robustus]|eukprot:ORX82213.1 acetylxylan esterase [Anaeromyces robustus]
MRANIAIATFLATSLSFVSKAFAAPDPNFHIYLAFGQSNMEGNGPIESQDRTVDKRFKMLATVSGCNNRQAGNWYDATPPLANCNGKLGPVDYFGRTLVKKLPQEIRIGAVVVAVAGCDIQLFEKDKYRSYQQPDWMRGIVQQYGGNPYGRLIEMAKKAQQEGIIKGILLHQGETNTGQQDWPNRVKGIYENILNDLGLKAEDVPLLAGEVVSSAVGGQCGSHNAVIQRLPSVIKTAHVISSQGLQHQGDGLHFTSAAYRTFGERYAEEMLKILGDVQVVGKTTTTTTVKTTTTKPVQPTNPSNCWSLALGYPCCVGNDVIFVDESGEWGVENNNWCGIVKAPACWATALGYDCCSTNVCRTVYYEDNDGKWDVENGQWCGITSANKLC